MQSLLDSILNPGFENEKEARKFLRNKVHVPNLKMVKTFSDDTVNTDDASVSNPAKKAQRVTAKTLREERLQRQRKKQIGLNRTYTIEIPEGETADSLLSQLKSNPNIAYAEKLIKVETFATNFNDVNGDGRVDLNDVDSNANGKIESSEII